LALKLLSQPEISASSAAISPLSLQNVLYSLKHVSAGETEHEITGTFLKNCLYTSDNQQNVK